jgi:hypothetical protein
VGNWGILAMTTPFDAAWDACVLVEEDSYERGMQEGLKFGEDAGFVEGYRLGWKDGVAWSREASFYLGVVEGLTECETEVASGLPVSGRARKVAVGLKLLLVEMEVAEAESEEAMALMDHIRAKYKQLVSLLRNPSLKYTVEH